MQPVAATILTMLLGSVLLFAGFLRDTTPMTDKPTRLESAD
jgi:hypothetical protein